MKFKILHSFKFEYTTFEEGNTHDSQTVGASDEMVAMWHRQGWVLPEGESSAPAIDPSRSEVLQVDDAKFVNKTTVI